MIYEFVDTQTGEGVEIVFPMGECPGIGDKILHDGREVERVFSMPAGIKVLGLQTFKPFASESMREWHPDAPRHDDRGRAVFQTRAEQDEFINKNNARARTKSGKEQGFREIGARND